MVCSVGGTEKGKYKGTMKLAVSIVIVNYNTGEFLTRCISSIRESSLSLPYEILIVDNASTDESLVKIKKHTLGQQKLKVIENTENLGFARAVNQGITLAKGEYILLLNPDTEIKKGSVEKLVEFAKANSDAGVVGAKLLNPDASVQPSVFRFPTLWRAFQEFWLSRRVYSKYAPQVSDPTEIDAVVGAAFLITPEARKRAGLLNERYFMYFEDLDYCQRVKNAGLKVYYLPEAQVVHYHGVSGRGIAPDREQWKRLIPSSKIYHGALNRYLINFMIWSGQKWQKIWHKF